MLFRPKMEIRDDTLDVNIIKDIKIINLAQRLITTFTFAGIIWLGVFLVLGLIVNSVIGAYLIFEDMPNIAIAIIKTLNFFMAGALIFFIINIIFSLIKIFFKKELKKNMGEKSFKDIKHNLNSALEVIDALIKLKRENKKDVRRKRTTTRKSR